MRTGAMLLLTLALFGPSFAAEDLWTFAGQSARTHRFSTLLTAHDVKNHLASAEGRAKAIGWCRDTAVTKVYLESFRDGYQAGREALALAKREFREAGFVVSGCVTPTQVGKKSTGWGPISCFTDGRTQERIREIFEFTAGLFDEIMVDDFWFTDCTCPECEAARSARLVKIGARTFPVPGDTWEAYRGELMFRLSQEYVLAAARRVNPDAKVIVKYPQWYDRFHERGYDVLRETEVFDRIWVGTETRDYADPRWGGTVQYEGYFIMRWLGGIGGEKCGGGWYDWLGTTEKTYLEQARQTVLAGARESLLFCYGGLQGSTGPGNVEALRRNIPELQRVAGEVQKRTAAGIAAYKPAGSHPENEDRVFDFAGMLGLPLLPTHLFPTNAPAAFFSIHSLKDARFRANLTEFIGRGQTALVTDGLARRLDGMKELHAENVHVLPVKGDPKSLLKLADDELARLRKPILEALSLEFQAPNRVAFYPFSDGSWVVENFNDEPAEVDLKDRKIRVGARAWAMDWK